MPKMKTHRGAAKRFKVTGTGKITKRKANRAHLLEKKPTKRTRRLGRPPRQRRDLHGVRAAGSSSPR